MVLIKRLLQFSFFIAIIGLLTLTGFYFHMKDDLPSVAVLKDIELQTPMKIYSAEGELISQFGEKRRIPVKLDDMPQQLINAFLATEDNRFYQHFGVDPVGMGRAVWGQLIGVHRGGASTITMQTARNFFLTREQTYTRKLREIFISLHMERLLSKDEILELYLNKIELSHRAFGVGAAAEVYYGKTLDELTLAEIAVIAGLPKAPSKYNPISSPENAKFRRTTVLQRMLVSGYITEDEYQQANNEEIHTKRHGAKIELSAPYVAQMAHKKVLDMYPKDVAYNEGFKVYTTVSSDLQRAAEAAVLKNIYAYDERHGYRGPVSRLWVSDNDRDVLLARVSNQYTDLELEQFISELNALPSEALDLETIIDELKQVDTYQDLFPGAVLEVEEQRALVLLRSGNQVYLDWEAMSWARPFLGDKRQGRAPKTASDILTSGEVVYLRNNPERMQLSQLPEVSGAVVAISPDSGAIISSVGGYSFKQSQFNRVTQANRQVGSNIKPFVYSAALENDYTLASIVNDAPINQWDRSSGFTWRPKNSPAIYEGPLRVRTGLAKSKNVISVRLLRGIGLETLINHLSKFGFDRNELPRNESLALGSASLTPLQIVTGFAAFANGGYLVEPYIIDRIENRDGEIIYQANPKMACYSCELAQLEYANNLDTLDTIDLELLTQPLAKRIISRQNAFLIADAMNSVIWGGGGDWSEGTGWSGTGWRAKKLNRRDIAGKTGTTNESKDAWFTGFSRRIAASSWIGFDDPKRNLGRTSSNRNLGAGQIVGAEAGANAAQPFWIDFMETALQNYQPEPFEQPEDVVSIRIDRMTGKRSDKTDRSSIFEYFIKGTEPNEWAQENVLETVLEGDEENSPEEELF
ncbi:penicillin-binding protein 1A [Thalassotalea mangrovi]|uniref:Penicillin-binding protein 1A n=1 Tax=Thalassotalea mangrovi TaxID=2572245 RepID=A0A4U1B7V6_9GAMM|nr:penicillin-binding protein 1A [Thalassotalea mangrovi]TKB46713.1 penicillin-binding protein 1A [Thalassotalea mangrovi]